MIQELQKMQQQLQPKILARMKVVASLILPHGVRFRTIL